MGAITSNRRRGDKYHNSNFKFPSLYSPNLDNRIDTHISKKPKTSLFMRLSPERSFSSRSSVSRIYQYPEPVHRIQREVHAPCRKPKFGFSASSNTESRPSKEGLSDSMGNVFSLKYDQAKNCACKALRYLKKGKEVIEVDEETDKDGVSEDSSIEEVGVVDDEWREGSSVVLDRRSREVVPNSLELEGKVVEGNFRPSSSSVVSDLTNVNLKVDNAGKLLDSLSLDREFDVLGYSIHKKLYETAERRNPKLSSLSFQIELNEKHRASFQSLQRFKKPEEDVFQDVLREPFVPLTKEEEAEVSWAFSNSNRRKVLVTHENSNIQISGELLQCLRPGAWLNDEVINKLIGGRNGYDFKAVRRWTTQRKLGYCLLECDKIFVPIHKEIHWCLAVINKKDKKFQYLDSLRGIDAQVLKVLFFIFMACLLCERNEEQLPRTQAKNIYVNKLPVYFMDEVKDKSGEDIDFSSWKQEYVEDLPKQENGYLVIGWDCGLFMIKYADFYSRGLGLCFNQEHLPYFRLRTAKEILRLKAE
ncbi:unnamed protein product [Camellia sinensis]